MGNPWAYHPFRSLLLVAVVLGTTVLAGLGAARRDSSGSTIQFVFTSDAHYGLTRTSFRGESQATAATVNASLIASVNTLRDVRLPMDSGLRAGEKVGGLDFLVEGGDIANREEETNDGAIQPASQSWAQFQHDYVSGLHATNASGAPTRLFVVPGNHDATNAVGFYKPMQPARDDLALISIYNWMLKPPQPLDASTFDYARDRVFTSRDIAGVHFQFLHIWPDSVMRNRMAADLDAIGSDTPVIVFTHDQPEVEAKHFINPNGAHDLNQADQFENLLADRFPDGASVDLPSTKAQRELESFLVRHPNVTAYFHGNSNWHQAYEWSGPGHHARLHVFRVDSPMKGAVSADDERRLSFQLATIDVARRTMTVRECLWNAQGADTKTVVWGDSVTVTLEPRPRSSSGF